MQMMTMTKGVEDELKEEDDGSDTSCRRKNGVDRLGCKEWNGPGFKSKNRSSWSNPTQKTGSTGPNQISSAKFTSTTRKGENDHRSGYAE